MRRQCGSQGERAAEKKLAIRDTAVDLSTSITRFAKSYNLNVET